MRRAASGSTSASACGTARGRDGRAPPLGARSRTSSISVFHSPQAVQRPSQRGLSKPQAEQVKAVSGA